MNPGRRLYLVPTLLAAVCAASGRSATAPRSPRDTVAMTVNITHRIGPGSGKIVAGPGDLIFFHISALPPGPEQGTYQTVFKLTFPSSKDVSFPADENPNWHFPVVN